ncbi:MAG: electron transport complex subunit RsxE [Bacilli bacterium]|jgi:electron transport complex protein RnfE|nr:electron transport complex subunit RsxE [Bacilli bacterium]MCH4201404.1 electron transport complex subunit RsxE [Bacilli bacterium]MCH4236161.1 electron transport complex subunit RsxE [Bacilli bacterium]
MEKKSNRWKIFSSGIIANNPTFVMFLGTCPVLATTSSLSSAFGMGVAVIAVLFMTNLIISLLRKWIPNEVRIPVFIVIIATVVTIVQMFMEAYTYDLAKTLGVYLSIVVVNCIILGRAEAFASKNNPVDSILDALGVGIGFLLAVIIVSVCREVVGTGALAFTNPLNNTVIFNFRIFPEKYAINIFTQNTGAFIMYGLITAAAVAITSAVKTSKDKKQKATKKPQPAQGGSI